MGSGAEQALRGSLSSPEPKGSKPPGTGTSNSSSQVHSTIRGAQEPRAETQRSRPTPKPGFSRERLAKERHSPPSSRNCVVKRQQIRSQPLSLGYNVPALQLSVAGKGWQNKVTRFKALISYRRCCGELKYSVEQLRKDWASPGRCAGGAAGAGPYCPSTAWPGFSCPENSWERHGASVGPHGLPTSILMTHT